MWTTPIKGANLQRSYGSDSEISFDLEFSTQRLPEFRMLYIRQNVAALRLKDGRCSKERIFLRRCSGALKAPSKDIVFRLPLKKTHLAKHILCPGGLYARQIVATVIADGAAGFTYSGRSIARSEAVGTRTGIGSVGCKERPTQIARR